MSNLYNSLAPVYEAMYKIFINYEDEFNLYHQLLKKYKCSSVVEIGCGTGNLAKHFVRAGFDYTGLDNSDDMLNIAKTNNLGIDFIKAAMQDFILPRQMSSAIITGRTISYLSNNKDICDSLLAIYKNLCAPGVLCFDFIDANKFIPLISNNCVVHKASINNKILLRESFWKINLNQSWTFDWRSVFYEEKTDGNLERIGEDNSTIRAFTKDDIILFLELAGFSVKEMIFRKTYAFDTFVVVAAK